MKKVTTVLATALLAGLVLVGCGSSKPSGTYSSEGVSFKFEKSQVIVTEGSSSETCAYTADSDGNVIITLEGEAIPVKYDKKTDTISFLGENYIKTK